MKPEGMRTERNGVAMRRAHPGSEPALFCSQSEPDSSITTRPSRMARDALRRRARGRSRHAIRAERWERKVWWVWDARSWREQIWLRTEEQCIVFLNSPDTMFRSCAETAWWLCRCTLADAANGARTQAPAAMVGGREVVKGGRRKK
jgi:hypothetical protein